MHDTMLIYLDPSATVVHMRPQPRYKLEALRELLRDGIEVVKLDRKAEPPTGTAPLLLVAGPEGWGLAGWLPMDESISAHRKAGELLRADVAAGRKDEDIAVAQDAFRPGRSYVYYGHLLQILDRFSPIP